MERITAYAAIVWDAIKQYAPIVAAHIRSYTPDLFLTPGTWTLGLMGLGTETPALWSLALMVSLFVWVVGGRIVLVQVFRLFGLYNPESFRFWVIPLWRGFYRPFLALRNWTERAFVMGRRASAGWTTVGELMTLLHKPGRIFLGRIWSKAPGGRQPVGIKGERHLVMVAGSGSGKTTQLITMAALHKGNSFIIDPKGQVTRVLYRRLQTGGGAVVGKNMDRAVLDPYGMVSGIKESSSWNALGEITRAMEREGADAAVRYSAMIAEGLVVTQPGDKAYFPDSARNFLQGLILFVLAAEPAERQHLVRVRELLMNGLPERAEPGENPFDVLLFEMSECTAFNGLVAGRARTIADGSASGSGDILSTARQQTAWLDYPEIRAISKTNSFYLEDLKSGALNLSVCAPVTDLQKPLAGWFRLLTVLSMYIFERIPGRLTHPCLFALDEMPSLGHIAAVETAAPLMRGFGIRLLAVTQDIEALQRAYPKGWGGFLGNAEAVFWMGTNHDPTAQYLERTLGNALIKEAIPGTKPARYRLVERPLLTADQVKRFLQGSNMIVTRYGKRPMRLKATPYFSELPVYYYDRDKDYRETPLRMLSRLVLSILRFVQPPQMIRSLTTRLMGAVSYLALTMVFITSCVMLFSSLVVMMI